MKTIFAEINEKVPEAVAAGRQLRAWCAEHDVAWRDNLQGPEAAPEAAALAFDPDLIVALGGDGTLLRAVHGARSLQAPFLSIKFGRLGFLSGAPADRLIEAVTAALSGEASVEPHTMLEVHALAGTEELVCCRAVNELVLRAAPAHMLTTLIIINGHTFNKVSGDGLIIATATGSTAYALSAGGPVLVPSFEGAEVVPLAPHTLINRAVVTAAGDQLRIELPDPTRAEAILLLDGEPLKVARPVTAVEIRTAPEKLRLVKLDAHNAYKVVARQFFGLNVRDGDGGADAGGGFGSRDAGGADA